LFSSFLAVPGFYRGITLVAWVVRGLGPWEGERFLDTDHITFALISELEGSGVVVSSLANIDPADQEVSGP
jgi:hypothetical protein